MYKTERPLFVLVSAPSGAGKTTLCHRLLDHLPNLKYSISCTTRPPREGEVDGESYHFLTREQFEARMATGDFIEYAEVYGNYYGTLRETVLQVMKNGHDVLMDVDVQGADQLREYIVDCDDADPVKKGFTDIFMVPPSRGGRRRRITGRATDAEEVIERRMNQASHEMESWKHYKFCVVNDDLDQSFDLLCSILHAEHCRVC